jgi:hypothetical protein
MRLSLAFPLPRYECEVSGLSEFGHFFISTRLLQIDALWDALGGAPGYNPLQSAYDVFASVISNERALDDELLDSTIPSLVAEAAEEYHWMRFSKPLSPPLDSQVLERIRARVSKRIAKWRRTIVSPANPRDTLRLVPASNRLVGGVAGVEIVDLNDLPRDVAGEPKDIEDRRRLRQAAIEAYKSWWKHVKKSPITDSDIAREAGWSDRTAIARFKRCSGRNSEGADKKIWDVLRSKPSKMMK